MRPLPIALVVLLALSVAACQNIIIRPPGYAAGPYDRPNGPGER
jgi:hypothetical protein